MLIPCKVERHAGVCLLITFPNRPERSLLLQSDSDQASFANSCGICDSSNPLDQSYVDCEPTDITQCPDDYLDIADIDEIPAD